MNYKDNGNENFLMVYQMELQKAMSLVQERRLELRDMAVFMGLMSEMNWRSGKVRITAKALSKKLGISFPVCVSSISRLRKELLVVRVKEERSGELYFLLNPYVASVGGVQRKGYLWKQFVDVVDPDRNDG
tara:strand:+ start:775 stop:1167 length:393 start_codon:yes stop_codon:yes gene_type:complete